MKAKIKFIGDFEDVKKVAAISERAWRIRRSIPPPARI